MLKSFHKSKHNSGPASTQGGTTLIELLVVIAIILILTGISIFNYRKFNSYLSIQNLADDIALTVRKAQGFAIGVRGSNATFTQGYGIHFSRVSTGSSNKSFILFVDGGNNTYDDGESIEILSIKSNDQISDITPNNDTLDVMFNRPDPEAHFFVNGSSISGSSVKIKISSIIANSEVFRYINIYNTGQISVTSS